MIVAGEVPLVFWKRQVMWRGATLGGTADYDGMTGKLTLEPHVTRLGLDDPALTLAARTDADVCNFLFWSRMPLVIRVDGRDYLSDQRFPALRRTTFMVPLDKAGPSS